jgi:putative NAD(P)-binding protein
VTRPIVVLGGYGRIGRLCVQELVARTRAPIKIAGRNAQRAESVALSFEERASASYTDASQPRVLARTLEGAAAVVACCGGDLGGALQATLELRVPFVGLSPIPLGARGRAHVAELAWKAQVPIVLHAGALPGIPGLLAESLVRRLPSIRRLEIASTGPFAKSDTARRDQSAAHESLAGEASAARRLPELWTFAEPVGRRALVRSASADLEGFTASHLVDELRYLEPPEGWLTRAFASVLRAAGGAGFAVAARAFCGASEPEAELEVSAADPLGPAAAIATVVTAAILQGHVPAGLASVREAISPALALGELEKRGVRVRVAARS